MSGSFGEVSPQRFIFEMFKETPIEYGHGNFYQIAQLKDGSIHFFNYSIRNTAKYVDGHIVDFIQSSKLIFPDVSLSEKESIYLL